MLYRQRTVQVSEPSQEEIRLANLSQSGEDAESLLSGGASINDLVMAGILEDDYDPEAAVFGNHGRVHCKEGKRKSGGYFVRASR